MSLNKDIDNIDDIFPKNIDKSILRKMSKDEYNKANNLKVLSTLKHSNEEIVMISLYLVEDEDYVLPNMVKVNSSEYYEKIVFNKNSLIVRYKKKTILS